MRDIDLNDVCILWHVQYPTLLSCAVFQISTNLIKFDFNFVYNMCYSESKWNKIKFAW